MITKIKLKNEMALAKKPRTNVDLEKFKNTLNKLDYYDKERLELRLFYYIVNNTNYIDDINIIISRFLKLKKKIYKEENLFNHIPDLINSLVLTLKKSNEYLNLLQSEIASCYKSFFNEDFYGERKDKNLRNVKNCLKDRIEFFYVTLEKQNDSLMLASESSLGSISILRREFDNKNDFLDFLEFIKNNIKDRNVYLYGTNDLIEKKQKSYFNYYNLTGLYSYVCLPIDVDVCYRFFIEMNWFHDKNKGFIHIDFDGPSQAWE